MLVLDDKNEKGTKLWSEIICSGSLPSPRFGHSMVRSFTNQDEFFVIGGNTNGKMDKGLAHHM